MRINARHAIAAVAALLAGQAQAQPVEGGTARAQLFSPEGVAVAVSGELTEMQRSIVQAMASEAGRAGRDFSYYGSIAFSPSDGLQSRTLQGAFNFHSPGAADRAALAACAAQRPDDSASCIVAGRILPQGWEARDLQMSQAATRDFEEVYLPAEPPKAFAISRETGSWAVARGASAAAEAERRCNDNAEAKGAPRDCATVIAE